MTTQTGIQVPALFRAYLNRAGIDWKECERIGNEFNAQLESSAWLSTDSGQTFDRTQAEKEAQEASAAGNSIMLDALLSIANYDPTGLEAARLVDIARAAIVQAAGSGKKG